MYLGGIRLTLVYFVLIALSVCHVESGVANIQVEEDCWPVAPFLLEVPTHICCYLLDGVPVQRVCFGWRKS